METDARLKKLEELIKVIDEGVTKKDFTKAFEEVLKLVLKIEKRNSEAVSTLETTYQKLLEKMDSKHSSAFSDLRGQVDQLFVGNKLDEIRTELDSKSQNGMANVEGRLGEIQKSIGEKLSLMDKKDLILGRLQKTLEKKIEQASKIVSDDPGKIRNKLESLKGDDRLDKSAIRGLDEVIKEVSTRPTGGVAAKPITIQGLGITIDKNVRFINFTGSGLTSVTRSKDGVVTVNIGGASSGTKVSEEVPTNSGDNTNFTIAHTPTSGTFRLYRGGARQQSIGATPDYTLTGTALVLTIPLDVANGEALFADYEY